MLIGPLVPQIQLFQKLTLKIQGQGHGWGQSSKSQCESNILSTHIPLVPCQSAIPFPRNSIFKIWPWKSKVKAIAQGHKVGITPYRPISLSIDPHIPGIQLFQNLPLKIQGQSHWWGQSWKWHHGSNIQSTHIPFVPCQSDIPFLRYFFKIWPCNQGSRSWVRS